MSDSNSRLVYSTETGRIDEPKAAPVRPKGDGVVRIQRQTSGRKGKGVCLITGVDLDDAELTKLAAELKKKCGCGGAVKDGIIEIQGDKRDLLKSLLEAKGMKVHLAGGEHQKPRIYPWLSTILLCVLFSYFVLNRIKRIIIAS